jgi:hypothetical protein
MASASGTVLLWPIPAKAPGVMRGNPGIKPIDQVALMSACGALQMTRVAVGEDAHLDAVGTTPGSGGVGETIQRPAICLTGGLKSVLHFCGTGTCPATVSEI